MKIGEYLSEHGVAFRAHDHSPAYTAQEVAAEEHISGYRMAKTVVVRADDGFALCVLPASYKLDLDKVAKALKARKVRLADEGEMAELFPDVEVGAEPPFGSLYNIPTYVDRHMSETHEMVFQAGSHHETIRMKYDDYVSLVKPVEADLSVHV